MPAGVCIFLPFKTETMNRIYRYALLVSVLWSYSSNAQGLKVMPGTTFKLTNGSYTLVLNNGAHLENNAAITGNNFILKATGTGSSQLKGTGALSVAQVQVNKAAGQSLVLQKNLNVAGSVAFSSGLLDLNGFDLILADTAMLVNETNASRITGASGAVQITQYLDAPLAENPGNLGLVITSGATWGNTVIRRSHQNNATPGGGLSVSRNYKVTPASNTGLNTFLRMYYLDAELNALDENILQFFRSDDNGAQWSNIGAASRNTTQNFVNINGLQSMALLTLSTTGNPLPLEFAGINITCIAGRVQLRWQYNNALPGAYFRVDKSRDGAVWHNVAAKIAVEPAAGAIYTFTDDTEPFPYYRMQYVTTDGRVAYSPVQEVNCKESGYNFRLMQNPVGSTARVWIQAKWAVGLTLRVYDLQGRLMLEQPRQVNAGVSQLDIDVSGIAAGMYLLQLDNAQGRLWQTKFIK